MKLDSNLTIGLLKQVISQYALPSTQEYPETPGTVLANIPTYEGERVSQLPE